MNKPEFPEDESCRMDTLRSLGVLDTPPEERFDRLTRMAKRIFDVPIALVSIVDENRQWFKSCMGLDAQETHRDISFCGHAILGNGTFVIPDALEDKRFSDNPLVTGEPRIRFYAGCPLKAYNGQQMGTLCIIDQRPRELSQEDLETLADLASMAEQELAAIQLATLDELTGLSNRRGFLSLAQYGLHFCARQHLPTSLVFLDLDKFKEINDTFGHAEGDHALRAFADHIQDSFRHSDLVARFGGDEFAILLTNTSRQGAEVAVHKLADKLHEYNKQAGRGYDIAFSYGIVESDCAQSPSIEALLKEGDALMYADKHHQRR